MTKRRGRKRKANVPRHPKGRIVHTGPRSQRVDQTEVVAEARQRVHSVFPSEARYPEAGYAIGRLYVARRLSKQHLEAARKFEEVHRDHERAILAKPMPSANDLDRQFGHDNCGGDEPNYVARCSVSERVYGEARRVLLEASTFAMFAVQTWVIEDKAADVFIKDLKLGLAALAKLWGIPAEEKCEAA